MNARPLEGLTVLEFSQYMSGPSAGLRMADLGARVIKIERPQGGDPCRRLAIKNLWADDSTLLFHTINRNKESFSADLKNPNDLLLVKKLMAHADIVTHNFRPGVMEKIGLSYQCAQQINPRIIWGEITGYGKKGPWKNKPGQDLLLQSMSGLVFTSGNEGDNPVPFGLAVADMLSGAQLVQGILAILIRRHRTGKGGLIEVSLMESVLDFQFELLTTYYQSGQLPRRSSVSNGHPLLGAPYGIFRAADGYLSLAMVNIRVLAAAIHCEALNAYAQEDAFNRRDMIKEILSTHLQQHNVAYWMEKLQAEDLWAMEVLDWRQLTTQEAYQCLQMEQQFTAIHDKVITTTRCPIRINGQRLYSDKPAPQLGEHTQQIKNEFLMEEK